MNLYKFDYNGWGEYYFVMSENEDSALQALKDYLKNIAEKDGQFGTDMDGNQYVRVLWEKWKIWKDITIDQLPKGYILEVIGPNVVQQEEYS
jgi:hypothetical protein